MQTCLADRWSPVDLPQRLRQRLRCRHQTAASLSLFLHFFLPFVIVKSVLSCTAGKEDSSPPSRSPISTFCFSFLPFKICERKADIFLSEYVLFSHLSPQPQTSFVTYLPCQTFLSFFPPLNIFFFFLSDSCSPFLLCCFHFVTCLSFIIQQLVPFL